MCWVCKEEKSDDSFWKDRKRYDGLQGRCISCAKESYVKNKTEVNANNRKRARHSRDRLMAVAAERMSGGCITCGENNILVLEFDHRDPSKKVESIAFMISYARAMNKFLEELDKCDVLCANCHRIKTSYENNSWRLKYLS